MQPSFDADRFTHDAKQNWTSVADRYDRLSAALFPPITSAFLSFVQLQPGHLVLDVACGPGYLTTAAAHAVGTAGRVVGVDLSPGMLKLAMGRATQRNLEYREMNAEALDLPDGVFNVVLCQLGLMLFARPQTALHEMTRVCKKGGTIACLVQGNPERMLFTSLVMKALVKQAPELKQPGSPHIYAFAPVGVLDQALIQAGLWHVVSSRISGVFLFDSPEDYWKTMTEGGGRTGAVVRSLPEDKQKIVRDEVLSEASRHASAGKIAIPYEVVMAKGLKP